MSVKFDQFGHVLHDRRALIKALQGINGILALDLGTRKTGLAITDKRRQTALPIGIVHHDSQGNLGTSDRKLLFSYLNSSTYDCLVVGRPLQLDGRYGSQCKIADRILGSWLQNCHYKKFSLWFHDERLSSALVEQNWKGIDNELDDYVACQLLEEFLVFGRPGLHG